MTCRVAAGNGGVRLERLGFVVEVGCAAFGSQTDMLIMGCMKDGWK